MTVPGQARGRHCCDSHTIDGPLSIASGHRLGGRANVGRFAS